LKIALLLAIAVAASITVPGCAPRGAAQRGDTGSAGGGALRADAPGAVALAPLGARTSPCRTDSTRSADLHARGLRQRLEFEDQPVGRAGWRRRVLLELDSADRPRRIRVLAGATSTTRDARRPLAGDTLDLVQAWLIGGALVESGLVARVDENTRPPHHYWTGDPLPALLHGAVVDFARAALAWCSH